MAISSNVKRSVRASVCIYGAVCEITVFFRITANTTTGNGCWYFRIREQAFMIHHWCKKRIFQMPGEAKTFLCFDINNSVLQHPDHSLNTRHIQKTVEHHLTQCFFNESSLALLQWCSSDYIDITKKKHVCEVFMLKSQSWGIKNSILTSMTFTLCTNDCQHMTQKWVMTRIRKL